METFAPAYFDYMSSAVVAHVTYSSLFNCGLPNHELLAAPNPPGKNLRLL